MSYDSSPDQVYKIAHTAQCRLKLNAERPDRNLRFLLGHAFTLDKLMLRIVEIEDEEKLHEDKLKESPVARRVSFHDSSNPRTGDLRGAKQQPAAPQKRAPSPPPEKTHGSDTSSDDYDMDEEDDEDAGLSLTHTTSHIAGAPYNCAAAPDLMTDADNSDDSDEDDEPISPPSRPSDSVLETITEEEGDEMLAELYDSVRGCGCQKHAKAPKIERIWEVPSEAMEGGRRTAVVQVAA